MSEVNSIIQIVVNAVATGFGSAVGVYLASKSLLKHIDKLIQKLNGKHKKKSL